MLAITAAHTEKIQREQLRRVRQYLLALFDVVLTSFLADVRVQSRCPIKMDFPGNSLSSCVWLSGMEQLLS